jgi:3,4-dihydroxy 2-butanone 4-phosphate synthase / GTP cyclohydrolase II
VKGPGQLLLEQQRRSSACCAADRITTGLVVVRLAPILLLSPRMRTALQRHDTVDGAGRALDRGRLVVMIDEVADRGDLVLAAVHASGDLINVMAREARGLVCLALDGAWVDRLRLRPMVAGWQVPDKAFTVSVEARQGITTGISAAERAHTIRTAVAPDVRPEDLVSPGHVFPLRAREPGDRARGRTEAAVALARHARTAGAVLCELLDDDGELASAQQAVRFARQHQLVTVSLQAVLAAERRGAAGETAIPPPDRSHDLVLDRHHLW